MAWGLFFRIWSLYIGTLPLAALVDVAQFSQASVALIKVIYFVGAFAYLTRYLFQHRDEIEGRAARR